jgi:beta-lactam-binding protein with PASTA domain
VASIAEIQLPGIPADQVLAQSPPPNASQVAAPKTNLLISAAPDAPAFVLPNFVGQPLGSAARTLQDAGFKLGTVSLAPPAPADPGAAPNTASASTPAAQQQPSPASMIVTQWPPAGQKVLMGAVVNFEVR